MTRLATIAMVVLVIGSGAQATIASPIAQAQPVPDWVYLWVQRSDQVAEVWRGTILDHDWQLVGAIPGKVLDVISTAADPEYVLALTDRAIYRSRDAGETWQALSGLPDWPTAITVSQQTAGLLYLGTLNSGAFQSADAGDTWQSLSPVVDPAISTLPEVTAITVQPQDDDIIFMATGYWLGTFERHFTPQGIFMSLNGGETWSMIHQAGLDEARVTILIPDVHNALAVQAGAEDGSRLYISVSKPPANAAELNEIIELFTVKA